VPRSLSRRQFVAASAAAALVLPTLPSIALADDATLDNSTPDRARRFVASQSAALGGGDGGRFHYYKFNTPGGRPVKFSMDPGSTDKTFLRAVGYKVYGPIPGKVYAEGRFQDDMWKPASDIANVPDAGDFLIQVYNYNRSPDAVMRYTLSGENIPPQPGDAGAGDQPAEAAPGDFGYSAIPTTPDKGALSGTLEGGAGGHFRYYQFRVGGNTKIGIDLQVTPDDAGILTVAGFKLYGPQAKREYLVGEARKGRTPNVSGDLWVTEGGVYVVQVYNYSPNRSIDYTLSTRGAIYQV
jgi:hypothetical protein